MNKIFNTKFMFLLPIMTGVSVFFLVPFVIIIILSFSRGIGRLNFVGIENYVNVINSPSFQLALANTLKFLIIGIPLIMIVSFIIALSINVKLPGFKYIKSTMLMPYVLPISSLAIIIQIFITEHGIFNGALNYFGVDTVNLLQSDKAFVIVIVMYVWKNFGYNVILILVSLNAIPPQLYEAASIDGASSLQKVFSITIPMIIPNLIFVSIISVINSFKSYREIFLLGGEHPHESIYMIQHYINNNFENLNYPKLAVSSILLFTVIILFVLLMFCLQIKWREKNDNK